jgi:hypothetical protein
LRRGGAAASAGANSGAPGRERHFTVAASSVHRFVQALSCFADLTTMCSCTERPPRSEDPLSTADGFDLDCR